MTFKITHEPFDVLTFKLGEKEYAIDVGITEMILGKCKIFKVPNSPDFLKGIVNLRGEIIPVFDLKSMINLEDRENSCSNVIIVKIDADKTGFLVDEVTEIMSIRSEFTTMKIVSANYIKGAIIKQNRLISFLDLQDLLVGKMSAFELGGKVG